MDLKPDSEVAARAAELIRERGLARYVLVKEGRLCFTGSVLMAQAGKQAEWITEGYQEDLWSFGFDTSETHRNQLKRIQAKAGDILKERRVTLSPGLEAIHWNNQAGRTAEEVATLLDEVATKL